MVGVASATQMDTLMNGVKYCKIKAKAGVVEEGSMTHSTAMLKIEEHLLKWMATRFCAIEGL